MPSYFKDIVLDAFKKGFEKVELFWFVDNAELIPNTDKPDVFILPTLFNDALKVVAFFNDVNPETSNDSNLDVNVEGFLKLINEGGFNL